MEWTDGFSLAVGGFSMILAGVAITVSILSYLRTKDVLAQIDKKAGVIEEAVGETQSKLVDTVTAIARPKEDTPEQQMLSTLLPAILSNPELLEQLIAFGKKQEEI